MPVRDRFVHLAHFYRGTTEYLAGIIPFIRAGLRSGDPVAVAVPGPNLAAIENALGPDGGAVRWFDMTEAGRNPGRIIPGVLRAFADGYPGEHVRIVGEPVWPGRSATEYPACAQHEALINAAFTGQHASILCPYDAAGLRPAMLSDAAATHPVLTDATGERRSDAYDPERVVSGYNMPLPPPPPHATELDVDGRGLAGARREVTGYASGLGLPPERVDDLVQVVDELLTNSITHAGGRGVLLMWADDTRLVCEVRDGGHIADPLAGRLPARPDQLGGRGLLLVNHLADLVRMHTTAEGNTVRVHFALR